MSYNLTSTDLLIKEQMAIVRNNEKVNILMMFKFYLNKTRL